MDPIKVPAMPEMNDSEKVAFATEMAFNQLLAEGARLGLPLAPVMGLVYLPDEKVTQQFQDACRTVIASILIPRERCKHERLNEDGICHLCGQDCRGSDH